MFSWGGSATGASAGLRQRFLPSRAPLAVPCRRVWESPLLSYDRTLWYNRPTGRPNVAEGAEVRRGGSLLTPEQTVLLERSGPVARVILNRPEVLNAVNRDLIAGIRDRFAEVAADDEIRVVILTGAGRGFSSGGDLKKAPDAAAVARDDPVRSLKEEAGENVRVLSVLELSDKITIAAINGPAVGVGLEIACAADFRVAKESARMAFVQTVMGMVPMYAFGLLPPLMRLPDIKKMVLLGEFIEAPTALRIGLVDEVYPDAEFDARVTEFAERLSKVQPQVCLLYTSPSPRD